MNVVRLIKKKLKNWIQVFKLEKKYKSLILGKNVNIQNGEYISLGEDCVIGDDSKLLCTNIYNGKKLSPSPQLIIGNNFHVTRNLTIQCARRVEIGNDVLFASNIFIVDYNHGVSPMTNSYLENDLIVSDGIKIEDGVWIGNNVIVLGGVTIGKKSIVGAGSVITKNVPEYTIVVGNPASVKKIYNPDRRSWEKYEEIDK